MAADKRRFDGAKTKASVDTLTSSRFEWLDIVKASLEGQVHHSDHGSQYVSIIYNDKFADYGVLPSTGTAGDPYHNARAETTGGLYNTEPIHSQRWESLSRIICACAYFLRRICFFTLRDMASFPLVKDS